MEAAYNVRDSSEFADVQLTNWLELVVYVRPAARPVCDKWDTSVVNDAEIISFLGSLDGSVPVTSLHHAFGTGIICNEDLFFKWEHKGTFTRTCVYYTERAADAIRALKHRFPPIDKSRLVKWFYASGRDLSTEELPLSGFDPLPEFYPWVSDLSKLYGDFLSSSANVLLLIGPPGTGKTTFIRGLLRKSSMQAWVTYDAEVQSRDALYVQFSRLDNKTFDDDIGDYMYQEPNGRILVLEDADDLLSSRKDGNKVMSKILNLSDGLISVPARKLVFSTNLPSLSSVDPALLRPGRCFAVINFRSLSAAEAGYARGAAGLDGRAFEPGERTVLSEVLNDRHVSDADVVRKIGFA